MSSNTNAPTPTAAVDTTPLLGDQISAARPHFIRRPPSLPGAARFLRRASGRIRTMREPSVRVREAAAQQIEEHQSGWAYSKPIVILDLAWNLAFVIASIAVMITSREETPTTPLRLWIVGYTLQCILHMVCVWAEYKKRYLEQNMEGGDGARYSNSRSYSNLSSASDDGSSGDSVSDSRQSDDEASVAKNLESANSMFSFVWWIIGFYWVSAGGQSLTSQSPQLYWLCLATLAFDAFDYLCRLCIAFLAFDVFFVVICVLVACVIGVAVCCCLPCIIAILYAVADQEGATKEDIERLPTYKFRKIGDFDKQNGEIKESFGGIMTESNTDSSSEHVLPLEDAECCICLCSYDDGAELRELPCRHHFHSSCIDKWLHMNATCPLCKFNILKNGSRSSSEEV